MKIEITEANEDKKPILANLLQLYLYEFTEIWNFDIGDNGFYSYEYLPLYWSSSNRYPFLIYVDSHIAGFVFIQKGSPLGNDPGIWDIAEFFILRRYRKQKVGTEVALYVWNKFKGRWQVRVLVENKRACLFWKETITNFAPFHFLPEEKKDSTRHLAYLFF